MKKISSKQKLIYGISIILVAVILAIVITTNIIKNNNQVASEGYTATTANANSNLVASYIKSGITIGGITGTLESINTFDATALPEDILWGETAYVKGEKITGTKIVTVAHAKAAQKTFEENTVLIDDYGNNVKIPAGFKIAEDSATAVTGGVVIEDVSAEGATEYTKGSQFVWVPVGDVLMDNDGNKTTITLGRYTFDNKGSEILVQSGKDYARETQLRISGINDGEFLELLNTTPSNNAKAKDISEFVKRTFESQGYFIGRYELGDALATNDSRSGTDDISNSQNPVACKSGIYPYTYINQADAAKLCRNMYSSNNFESDLINSYALDTAIVFIQKFSGDTNFSLQVGKSTVNSIQKCGVGLLENVSSGEKNQDERCNIFDLAGNTGEWSTEEISISNWPCVARGGSYNYSDSYVSSRNFYDINYTRNNLSARPIIYL